MRPFHGLEKGWRKRDFCTERPKLVKDGLQAVFWSEALARNVFTQGKKLRSNTVADSPDACQKAGEERLLGVDH